MDEIDDIQEDFCRWLPDYIRHYVTEDIVLGTYSRAMDLMERGFDSDVATDVALSEALFSMASQNLAETLGHAGLFKVEIPLEKEVRKALTIKVPPDEEHH